MLLIRYFSYLLLLFFLVSCSKVGSSGTGDNNTSDPHVFNPQDVTAPVIIINTPAANQVFSSGNTIQVSGRATDDLGLYRGSIRIINDASGIEVKQQAYEIHGPKSYDFNLSYVANVSVVTDYTVVVFFEDHGYNGTTKTVKVKVNP